MKNYASVFICFAILGTLVSVSHADNWAHWRGPTGNGVAKATPPVKWGVDSNIKWKVAIEGKGSGSPVVWEDKIFVVTGVPTDKEAAKRMAQQPRQRGRRRGPRPPAIEHEFKLLCFGRGDGKLLWEKTCAKKKPAGGTHSTNNFAPASPCTDGIHVYAHFGSQGLYCFTMDGELVWKRDDFPPMQTRNSFGEGSSPTLHGEKLILPWDHEGASYVFALNKKTGKTIWKTERDEPTNWGTPLVVANQVVLTGQNYVRSYDLETGKELWKCDGQTQRPCASPVSIGDVVVVGSGFRGAYMGAFKIGGQGDIENTDNVVWSLQRDTPDVASPILSENRLYFYKGKIGAISCVDVKSGKAFYAATRVPGLGSIYASPVAAGGHVYLSDRRGNTVVIKDTEKFEVVATNTLGETIDATPAPVDNQLIIRGEKHLFCIE